MFVACGKWFLDQELECLALMSGVCTCVFWMRGLQEEVGEVFMVHYRGGDRLLTPAIGKVVCSANS